MFHLSVKKGLIFIFESFMEKNHKKSLGLLLLVDEPMEILSQRFLFYLKELLETIDDVCLETELHK